MPLTELLPVGFIPTRQPEAARVFYEQTLGLRFVSDDRFAMVFRLGPEPGIMLRVVRMADTFLPVPFTIFGWEVPKLEEAVDELTARGVVFERYGSMPQDERGIWTAPGGDRIAWFKDPDGNNLSLSQHA